MDVATLSIILIVYGAATEQSIARLFLAGQLLAVIFAGYVAVWSLLHRARATPKPRPTLRQRARALKLLVPTVLLIVAVIGSIHAGLASPTEAAVVGVAGALAISGMTGGLDRDSLTGALRGVAMTTCMIAFILALASLLTVAMGVTGIPRTRVTWTGEQGCSQFALLSALLMLTTSVILPMVMAAAAGVDPIWFGLFLVPVVEMRQITPPLGFNLFVLQSITGRGIFEIAAMALPLFLILVLATAILSVFPEFALWLPGRMMSR